MPNTGKMLGKFGPVAIWLVAVTAVVALYVQRTKTFSVTGLAISRTQTVAAIDDGILRRLPAALYQTVKQDDVLAVVELGSPLQNEYRQAALAAQKATAQAELERLESELAAAKEKMGLELNLQVADQTLQKRRLLLDVEQAKLEILRIRTSLEPDRVQLTGVELEKKTLEQLLQKQAVEPYEVQKVQLQYEQLNQKIQAQARLLEQAEADWQQAKLRLETFPSTGQPEDKLETLLEPLRKALVVQEKRLAELFAPTTQMTLTAPFDGLVSAMYCTQGQAVTAGQTILTLNAPSADFITVWLDQAQVGSITEMTQVEVVKMTTPRKIFRSRVMSVGPVIEEMPRQLWKNPAMPQWGRPARIAVPPDAGLLGNEIVGIRGL